MIFSYMQIVVSEIWHHVFIYAECGIYQQIAWHQLSKFAAFESEDVYVV